MRNAIPHGLRVVSNSGSVEAPARTGPSVANQAGIEGRGRVSTRAHEPVIPAQPQLLLPADCEPQVSAALREILNNPPESECRGSNLAPAVPAAQSRSMSLVESFANVAIGFGLALLCNALMLPAFDLHPKRNALLAMTLIMTAVSVARSYSVRRLFEFLRIQRGQRA